MRVSQHDGPGDRTPEGQPHEQPAAPGPAAAPGAAPQPGPLYVPVRPGPAGYVVRLWRTPVGSRTAVAFTSDQRLRSVLGPTQPWIKLSESALRAMAEPLGAHHLTVDPLLTARPPAVWAEPATDRREPGRDPAGENGTDAGTGTDGSTDEGARPRSADLTP
ncbi:SAV_915 family protein [Actinacidiphila alni]|uniref:SAV_915 family protein n=1 Tax=Actinacidiphila alni TaxID=380248 RepID=UPI0034534663